MASIRKRTRSDGSVTYQAQIVIKQYGEIIHRESKSFAKKSLASDWAKRREIEIQESSVYKRRDYLQISDVIAQYIDHFDPTGRTKRADLLALTKRDVSKLNVHTLTAKDLIRHVRARNQECQPQTAQNDLIWLLTVIKTMKGVIDIDTDLSVFDSAREVLRREGLIAKSKERDRRPTKSELWALSRYFCGKPILHVMWFQIYSARRISETCRIEWGDINHDNKTLVIRNLKDPRRKGLKMVAKLPARAYKIVMRQPKGIRVFPYKEKTLSKYFSDACKVLGINDLHLHDLRHHATSLLFERGLSIQQVAQVTLHQQWATLKRYTNLDPGDLDI